MNLHSIGFSYNSDVWNNLYDDGMPNLHYPSLVWLIVFFFLLHYEINVIETKAALRLTAYLGNRTADCEDPTKHKSSICKKPIKYI